MFEKVPGLDSTAAVLYTRPAMKIMRVFAILSLFAASVTAQTNGPKPASTVQMVLPSHGEMLLGVFYLAAAASPRPTAVIFHGFPGFEQNLDIAQFLRAHGWNVLAMHYRGSWGVKGDFSFEHCTQDVDAQVRFLLDPANAKKYGIDTHRVVVIGHSMGGFMAASAAAHNNQVAGAVLISAWNIGAGEMRPRGGAAATVQTLASELSQDNNLLPLSGTSAEALAREIYEHQSALNMNNLASAIAPRPVFVITASEGLARSDHAFAEALRKSGDAHVTERHWDTDHSYSGERAELSQAILDWAQQNVVR
jgi:acetyl esterase/lipase